MYRGNLFPCMSVHTYLSSAYGSHKSALNPLELEIQTVVNHKVGIVIKCGHSGTATSVPNHHASSPVIKNTLL